VIDGWRAAQVACGGNITNLRRATRIASAGNPLPGSRPMKIDWVYSFLKFRIDILPP